MYCMRREDFEIETVKMNGNKLKAIVPKREISLEEAVRESRKILKR